MSDLRGLHDDYGGRFVEYQGRSIVAHYGKPERTHLAVRKGVGVTEQPYDVLIISGEDRIEYVNNVISNVVPPDTGNGVYGLLLDPKGKIRLDLYVYVAADRLLLFLPPGHGTDLAAEWRDLVFIQDVEIIEATSEYVVLTVTGPYATEKLASVSDVAIPEAPFAFVQATIADAGVTIIPTDGITGEETYDVVCANYDAEVVMDALLTRGHHAVPFGRETWESLTLEAGTPLLDTELEGVIPNVAGIRNAIDFEKGCFVGQEVVSRIENRGRPNQQLVGLLLEQPATPGDSISANGDEIGHITRGALSPSLEQPIAFGYVQFDTEEEDVTVGDQSDGTITGLPFVAGSSQSGRLPTYTG